MTTFNSPLTGANRALSSVMRRLSPAPWRASIDGDRPAGRRIPAGRAADCLEILLDITRLLSRVLHSTPTGVDRVELAFAQEMLRTQGERLTFVAAHPGGMRGRLPRRSVEDFLGATDARWTYEAACEPVGRSLWRAAASLLLLPQPFAGRSGRAKAYLHTSNSGLHRPAGLQRLLRAQNARYIPLVHDLIPLQHPEYARPGGAARFARRVDVLTALASGVVCNSVATAAAMREHMVASGRRFPIRAVPLATAFRPIDESAHVPLGARPYFVVLGTIEPRKNHLTLLHLWREMVRRDGPARTPALVVVGRRGWENEMVLDLLDRCPELEGVVVERGRLPDREVCALIQGARALLIPSFAEGFGLPVAEALALGTPVIASDLPALHEAGGEVPDYLDPLDGPAWGEAVRDYAGSDSPRRDAQLRRLTGWRPRPWADAVRETVAFAQEVCG